MKQRIVNIVKYNRFVYNIYYYVMCAFLSCLKIFIRPDDKLILFNSFAGRKYDDSPRAIYEAMINDDRFDGYRLVWAFHEPNKHKEYNGERIKTDTIKYFVTAIKAHIWVTNSSVERGLKFKRNGTLYFNTWHGTPIKMMGSDRNKSNSSFSPKAESVDDIRMTQSDLETDAFSRSFHIPRNHFLEAGLPRNDELTTITGIRVDYLRKKLNIPDDKKVILYCPTFREYEKDKSLAVIAKPPILLEKWEKELGSKYVLLFRAHYEVSKVMDILDNGFVHDMTNYPSINELMIISDILISDYSSIFFDYSITGKPMLHFCYDYDEYVSQRGVYFDIRDYLNGAATEDELIDIINETDCSLESPRTIAFREEYVNYYGHATEAALECMANYLNHQ